MKPKNLHEELQEHAPGLKQLKEKKLKPSIPEGYFEALQKNMLQRLSEEEMSPTPKNTKRISLYPSLRMAAAVALLLGVAIWAYVQQQTGQTTPPPLAGSEIEAYILQHLDEFDEELLITYALPPENPEQAFKLHQDDNPLQAIPDEELNEYLEEVLDEIDETTLENLL